MASKSQMYTWQIHNFSTNVVKYMNGQKYLRTPDLGISFGKIETEWCLVLNFNKTGIDLYFINNNPGSIDLKVKIDLQIATSRNNFVVKRSEIKNYAELDNGLRWDQLIPSGLINGDCFQNLQNDTLIINFEIELFRIQKVFSDLKFLDSSYNTEVMMVEIKNSFATKAFSDFKFICSDGVEIPAHRLICSAYSPVMKAMFNTEMKEAKDCVVHVTDIDGKTMNEVLRFIYTQSVCCIDTLGLDILYAAEKYGLDELKHLCLTKMTDNISIDNALEYFCLADRYNNSDLLTSSISFIKLNYIVLRENDTHWNNLNSKQWAMLLHHFHDQSVKYIHVFESSM